MNWLLLLACAKGPAAIVAADRSEHLLDRPFPADELIAADGTVILDDFPEAGTELGTTMTAGWARMAGETSLGFSHLAAVSFRFEAPLEGLEDSYPGSEDDPIQLLSLDSGTRHPIQVKFVASADGDPFLRDNLLLIAPDPAHPLRSGERYLAFVDDSLAQSPEGYTLPAEAPKQAAVATTFPVQDSLGQLLTLREETDSVLDAAPEMLEPQNLRRVVELDYRAGETPSGKAATVVTATFEGGDTEVTYLGAFEGLQEQTLDLTQWPMEVWQAEIQTVAWQDLSAQPYAKPGVGLITDFNRSGDGWIDFDDAGQLLNSPTAEAMRVVIQVPRTDHTGPLPVMTWDHGTGGHAYNAVRRAVSGSRAEDLASLLDEAGVIVVSRDQPLYGQRYPLIDEGFSASLGFYNVGNLPAFRDNQRQAGVDHRVLQRFCQEQLPQIVDADPERIGAFGHSLGSVTAHIGLALQQGDGAQSALVSGTGGYFTYYILDTGLLGSGNDVVGLVAPLIGVDEDTLAQASASELIAALVGVPESAWHHMDRFHPTMGLFQLIMDPSDPLVLAPEQQVPETIVLGVGDYQVPNNTTEWLGQALPDSETVVCEPQSDYDPHHCTYLEEAGLQSFVDFVERL